ncbi:TadE/TadG family type IV pilus assembly protein [Rhizobium ruizarguesonis]|jgi:Flp pilus assembly protein TadG|uniref:Pilus assembly protein n=1 Tax=Rhizobium ruizarguesonis TaxID=2081791 RepID=A0AB38HX78_9HYPH|nr:TadE/TadG family type IV pilus assembly protein [Rhizobium ruizarguesonis]NEI25933.1 pilus assembly protein [Rhizobium ruizarguesonis]TAT93878.1 pilus assembly protein [Rhizobium ruizarguesonis]TAZ40025.1 pilus assembly protein [Rhizobium ruizarguesonis]TBA34057.1 pilus assembly protein [Rhizobium ruizarguesonis]TBB85042.1 pilus assembly protein [Rhizobium ruizarguesonis]
MMAFRNFILHRLGFGFWRREEGAVLAEALLAIPFVTLFAAGILEFGSIFWQRMQIDAGLRDAGRYLSRCRPLSGTYVPTCNQATAKTIAFYGTQTPAADAQPRVPGWSNPADITITAPDADGNITIATAHLYQNSPVFSFLGIDAITISSSHEERYIGW